MTGSIESEAQRLALAGIVVAGLTHILIYAFILAPYALKGYADFSIFYTAGTVVRSGGAAQLYSYDIQRQVQQHCCAAPLPALIYNHAPHEALLFVPLSMFDYSTAYSLWNFINLTALFLISFVLRRYLPGWLPHWTLLPLAAAGSYPFLALFAQGQDSLLLMLVYTAVFFSFKTKRPLIAGACLALGTFKPQLIIPFLFILFIRRQWRAVSGFVIGTVFLALCSALTFGKSVVLGYFDFLVKFNRLPAEVSIVYPALMPNLRGLFVTMLDGRLPPHVITLLVIVVSSLLLWVAARFPKTGDESQISMALATTVLISYHLYVHDAGLFLVAAVLGFGTLRTRYARIVASAAIVPWFIFPAIQGIMNHHLGGLLAILVIGFCCALWLDAVASKNDSAQLRFAPVACD